MLDKKLKRKRRHKRIRAKIKGTAERPRFCVFRSSCHIYAQLINDDNGRTLVSADDMEIAKEKKKTKKTQKTELAFEVGRLIGQKALKKGIKKAIFDRAGYKYHGRIKSVAEGARQEGLIF